MPEALEQYRDVSVLVLGGDGFIGRWVARLLTLHDAEVHLTVIDRERARPVLEAWEIEGTPHQIDLTRSGAPLGLLREVAPALVVNAVGYGVAPSEKRAQDERLATALNAGLPGALVEALAAVPAPRAWPGRRLVHVGSIIEYGHIGGHLPETATCRPEGLYAQTKHAGAEAVRDRALALGVPALTARICQVYGPGEHPGRLLPLLLEARRTGTLPVLSRGTQRKDFTYVEETAEGLLRLGLTEGVPGEIVNLASGRLTTVAQFVEEAARLLHLEPGLIRLENPLPDNELVHEEVRNDRLRELTGWVPAMDIRTGLWRTLAFGEPPLSGR
jgi:UDP-glucose 4-epimerase